MTYHVVEDSVSLDHITTTRTASTTRDVPMRFIVGGYTASPPRYAGVAAESRFLAAVGALPQFGGLELPFTGAFHDDPGWLHRNLDPGWDIVATAIPGTVARHGADPKFGLASPDSAGRRNALEFTADLHEAVAGLNQWAGRRAVIAVEVHSAPRASADASAFADSLAEIATWNWGGTCVTVEHCDAYSDAIPPQKGYLPLDAEIAAVQAARQGDTNVGVTINWARSAIEARDPTRPEAHIRAARTSGALTGVMFSGCADVDTLYGPAWIDAHLPPSMGSDPTVVDLLAAEPSSLLTPTIVRRCLSAAGPNLAFTGLKISVQPDNLDVDARVAYIRDALVMIERAGTEAPPTDEPRAANR